MDMDALRNFYPIPNTCVVRAGRATSYSKKFNDSFSSSTDRVPSRSVTHHLENEHVDEFSRVTML
jgi:hypothetical protein